jgi:protein tyrosine phosphatase (PTP) superfamily phosphohydrolase (DUF442 family)
VQLLPPEPFDPISKLPPDVTGSKTTEPPVGKSGMGFPVGIPGFAVAKDVAKDNVYVGLRPSLDEGLDWLKANKFRRVLHVRPPGEDDSSDRKQAEKRGLKYVLLEVSPQTLSRDLVMEFAQIVRDEDGHPLFVYDRDSSLAGPMWYLYFRFVEQQSDEIARIRAGNLGLRPEAEAQRSMWLAVQKLLEK